MNRPVELARKVALPFVRVGVMVYLGVFALAWALGDRVAFQPPGRSGASSEEDVWITAADGTQLAGVHLTVAGARQTVMCFHGNAEDVQDMMPLLRGYSSRGVSVVAFDYRGYGKSHGRPTEQSSYEDAVTVYEWLTKEERVAPQEIVVHGRSIGGAVAADLVSRRMAGGLILESTFVSGFRLLCAVKLYPWEKFDVESKVRRCNVPTLILHGAADTLARPWHARALFAASASNKTKRLVMVDGAGHDDLETVAGNAYFEAIVEFLAEIHSANEAK